MRVSVDARLKPKEQVLEGLGLDGRGKVQQFLTDRILLRMRRYMPWRTGLTATSLTQVTGPAEITVNAPYAQRLYNGVSKSGMPLNYNKTVNPQAGPFWDRTLAQYEGKAIAEEAARFARGMR